MFKKTENKILLCEIEKLKKENKNLRLKLESSLRTKSEYEHLVSDLNVQKQKYKKMLIDFENIENEMIKTKERLINKNYR